ncbi:type 1 glutamine amidotransferase [Rhodococcus ruber]|uniref:Type 1 glutamine amidotransferase n=1 Tax=Rhodococcus ruber TaxID=1830 RepID=A0ABT4MEL5_9NOCA|nr:type 1 glutamine amidotransferase [Rhodococcus ruber]MCZ4519435.1 type 1 glutamine amidotransferase [Rhodococcus ruber]
MSEPRAIILVHDPAEDRRNRIPGALLPALASRHVPYDVHSFVDSENQEPRPDLTEYSMLIVMGSHESAHDDSVPWIPIEFDFVSAAVDSHVPVLGICFGSQLLARVLGGTVSASTHPERGFTKISSDDLDLVPEGPWMQLHQDAFTVPPSSREIARNDSAPQAFTDGTNLGVQFHPEITVDSFDSWVERWIASGALTQFQEQGIDIDTMRTEISRHEADSIRACDQLLGTFHRNSLRSQSSLRMGNTESA